MWLCSYFCFFSFQYCFQFHLTANSSLENCFLTTTTKKSQKKQFYQIICVPNKPMLWPSFIHFVYLTSAKANCAALIDIIKIGLSGFSRRQTNRLYFVLYFPWYSNLLSDTRQIPAFVASFVSSSVRQPNDWFTMQVFLAAAWVPLP